MGLPALSRRLWRDDSTSVGTASETTLAHASRLAPAAERDPVGASDQRLPMPLLDQAWRGQMVQRQRLA